MPKQELLNSNSFRISVLTALAMIAFAGNSLLCRVALKDTQIDPSSFTLIRLLSGAIVLGILVYGRKGKLIVGGTWSSALALFIYAAAFSFAYVNLSAATGALLLFGAVQATMIIYGFWHGERFVRLQWLGFGMAIVGLLALLLPGVQSPPFIASVLMLSAGIAWGAYSIAGKAFADASMATAGNFIRATPFSFLLSLVFLQQYSLDTLGVIYAVLSGALASGLGYAIWYAALPYLQSSVAATVQLSVPVIAAIGGIVLLSEAIHLRFVLASMAILGGIALVIRKKSA